MWKTTWAGWLRWLLISALGSAIMPPGSTAHGQATPVPAQLTILVRDANGAALAGVWLSVYLSQPPAAPRTVASGLTGGDGRLTLTRLTPGTTYVVQFDSSAPIIVDGTHSGSRPIQFQDDQNAGRELLIPDDVPGFPIHFGNERDATVRFVIGGTFSAGDLVAAVPMIDLAASDDAPMRPVHPLTGVELTPEQARTFHAIIGQPWGVTPPPTPAVLSSLPAGAADGVAGTVPPRTVRAGGRAGRLVLLLSTLVVGLMAAVVLLVRQRGRAR